MAEDSVNTSVNPEIMATNGTDLKRISIGKPSSPNCGQSKFPYCNSSSTVSDQHVGNSRRNYTAKLAASNNGRDALHLHIRASTGSFGDVANLKRNTTGKPSSPSSGGSVSPHYLRASTGSCHDFCKYGRIHEFEVKERHPIPKRVVTPPSDRRTPMEIGVLTERKTRTGIKPKPSRMSRAISPDSPSFIKKEVLSPSHKAQVPSRRTSSNEKKVAQNEKKSDFSGNRTLAKSKTMTGKPFSSPDTSGGLNSRRNNQIKTAKKAPTLKATAKKIPSSPAASLSPKPAIKGVVSLKKYRSSKLVAPLKDQNRIIKAEPEQPNSQEEVLEKTLHVIKVETEKKVAESIEADSPVRSSPSTMLSSPRSLSLPKSPALSFHEEETEEESEYTDIDVDDYISESSETVNLDELEASEGNHTRTTRKAGVHLPDDKDCPPVKLKFRRGKVVDLQSEHSGPRRLRFRRGRVLGGNQDSKADVRKRSLRKRVIEDDTNDTTPDSEKVFLRHQDVQDKKDAQSLFNNVIEETANKLVESRKSKVKALVGAFETVISLQETKPST